MRFCLNPIKEAILSRGLKQAFVADRCEISEHRLSRIVTGRTPPQDFELKRLSRLLNVEPEDLKP